MPKREDPARLERDQLLALRTDAESAALNLRLLKSRALDLQCFETAARFRDADRLIDEALDLIAQVVSELTDGHH